MNHLFKGHNVNGKYEGIFFDEEKYSREDAENEMLTEEGLYSFDGQLYDEMEYQGRFYDDNMPKNDADVGNIKLNRFLGRDC